jgi:monoterpene epsilon-lactone hydrolase
MASPELDTVLDLLRTRPRPGEFDLGALRAGLVAFAALNPPPAGTRATPVAAGGVPCEWVAGPGADDGTVVVYLHGGGYVLGSAVTHRGLAARLAAACGATALVVDYRLAPEHPFPAAVDDAVAAYQWLLARGVDPGRIVLAGDSAGGGLAAATLVALRDARTPLPAAGVLLSPWVDLEAGGASLATNAGADPMVDPGALRLAAAAYLGDVPARHPLASPLHAGLARLPPLLVQVGTREVLLDDAVRFAARARAAGVDVALERWDGMIHVWHAFAPLLPEATDALDAIGAFVRGRVGVPRRPLSSPRATAGPRRPDGAAARATTTPGGAAPGSAARPAARARPR